MGGLTGSIDDTEDTIATLLLRMETLETANNVLQEEVDTLKSAAAEQDQTNADLQATDNSTNDRLQVVEVDLQEVEVAIQGSAYFRKYGVVGVEETFLNSSSKSFKDQMVIWLWISVIQTFYEIFADAEVRLSNLEEVVQTHETDIISLNEAMAMLEVSMSDLEDTVDSVEDSMMAIENENDEIQQRLTVL